jgi:hypothetical protein
MRLTLCFRNETFSTLVLESLFFYVGRIFMTTEFVLGLFSAGAPQIIAASVLFLIGLVLIVKGGDLFVV